MGTKRALTPEELSDALGWIHEMVFSQKQEERVRWSYNALLLLVRDFRDYLDHPEQKSGRAWNLIARADDLLGLSVESEAKDESPDCGTEKSPQKAGGEQDVP